MTKLLVTFHRFTHALKEKSGSEVATKEQTYLMEWTLLEIPSS
jgi:hypothetical protein